MRSSRTWVTLFHIVNAREEACGTVRAPYFAVVAIIAELSWLATIALDSAPHFGGRTFKTSNAVPSERRVPSDAAVGTVGSFIVHALSTLGVFVVRSHGTVDADGSTWGVDIFASDAGDACSQSIRSRLPVGFSGGTHLTGGLTRVFIVASLVARFAGGGRGRG